jgi:hypothetical protein
MFLRALHPDHFNHEEGRFSSVACEPWRDGSLSVVGEQCALDQSGALHSHLRTYYPIVSSDPSIFWRINAGNQPANVDWRFEQSPGNADQCHVNGRSSAGEKISKFKERVSKHFKRTVTDLSMLSICDAKGERPLQLSDMDLFPRRSA